MSSVYNGSVDKWRNVDITDDFMFCSVFEDEEKCKELLQRILGIKIAEIKVVVTQKTINNRAESRGVRLDVYVKDVDNNSYDIEMQNYREPYIGKRSRYYHSEMDGYVIRKGNGLGDLKRSIVIFICTYDPFNDGRCIYEFGMYCKQNKDIELKTEAQTIIVNTSGDYNGVDDKLANVIKYIRTGKANDDFTEEIDRQVDTNNHDEDWRDRYMTLQHKLDERYEQGISQGLSQGLSQGRFEKSIEYVTNLMNSTGKSFEEVCELLRIQQEEKEIIKKALEKMKNN